MACPPTHQLYLVQRVVRSSTYDAASPFFYIYFLIDSGSAIEYQPFYLLWFCKIHDSVNVLSADIACRIESIILPAVVLGVLLEWSFRRFMKICQRNDAPAAAGPSVSLYVLWP